MGNLISINASVVSGTGKLNTYNEDNFFINGRYKFEYELDNIQVSIENEDDAHLFAVFGGVTEQMSVNQKLGSVYEDLGDSIKDNFAKVKKIVQDTAELAKRTHNFYFAGLLISQGKAIAFSTGDSRAYLCRNGSIRHLTVDYLKTKRLIRLGIITDEQAEAITKQYDNSNNTAEGGISCSEPIDLKKGDTFLLTSKGLSESIDDDRVQEILSMDRDTWFTSNFLVREAFKNGGEDNVTAAVISIDDMDENEFEEVMPEQNDIDDGLIGDIADEEEERNTYMRKNRRYRWNKQKALSTLLSVTTVLVIIAGIILTAYKIWEIKYRESDIVGNVSPTPQETQSTEPAKSTEPTVSKEPDPTPTNVQRPDPTPTPKPTTKPTQQPTQPQDNSVTYDVQQGDTLFRIAGMYYNSELMDKVEKIKAANNLPDDKIIPGQKLIIPNPEKTP